MLPKDQKDVKRDCSGRCVGANIGELKNCYLAATISGIMVAYHCILVYGVTGSQINNWNFRQ